MKKIKIKCRGAGVIQLDDLSYFQDDLKEISEENVQKLKNVILKRGFSFPFFVWVNDGTNWILDGHHRYLVLVKLRKEGYEVPALPVAYIEADTLQEAKAKLLELNSNYSKLNQKGFERFTLDMPDIELVDIDLPGVVVEKVEENKEGNIEDDEVPEVEDNPYGVVKGDVWQLGNHRLMCGDSTMIDDVEKLMDGGYPGLVHTDPPYGMNAVSKSGVLSKNYKKDIMGDSNTEAAVDSFKLIYGLYPKSNQIWWGANYYSSCLPDSECWLVWDKNNGESDQTDCELAWANFRSVVRQFTQASEKTNRVHPTQKPVSLVEWIIRRFKITSKSVLDVFAGSGTTLIAAEKHGIRGYGMELDEHYCSVIIKRWEEFTGNKAVRLGNDTMTHR